MRVRLRSWSTALTALSLLTVVQSAVAGPPSRRSRPRSPRDNVMRLATMLDDERTVAELKRERANAPRAAEKDVLDAMRAFEGLGDPEEAVGILIRRAGRFPEEAWPRIQLAQLYERMGKSENALPVWQSLDDKPGLSVEHLLQYARALSRLGKIEEAFKLLQKRRPPEQGTPAGAPPHPNPPPAGEGGKTAVPPAQAHAPVIDPVTQYWRDVAVLAWELDDSEEALAAYRKVWAADHRVPDAAMRLMTLAAEVGAREEATAVAIEGYKAEKNPRYLLFIAEQCEKVEDWACVAHTLDVPISEWALFEGREQFWLLRAEAFDHLGDKNAARDAYLAALRLNPTSVPIRLALLWDALDRRGTDTLREYVRAWEVDVPNEPEMWSPFAMALVRIGRVRDAIPFFQKRIRAQPGEYMTMVAFADALDQIHRGDIAYRLRRHAFHKLREGLLTKRPDPKAPADEFHLLEQHAELSSRFAGANEGNRWFSYAIKHSKPSEYRDDFMLGWQLGEDRTDYVKKSIASKELARFNRPNWDTYRLSLASTEDDRLEMARLLNQSNTLGYSERYRAELELGRDDRALATIQEQLVKNEAIVDEPQLRQAQREIFERHAPIGRAGGTYGYLDGLHLAGPDVLAAHEVGSARLIYEGWGREMTSPNGSVNVPDDGRRLEGDVGATLRFQKVDNIFEVGAGANYQKDQPVPHFELYHAHAFLRDKLSTVISLKANTPIDDTPFMRLAGVRNELQLVGHLSVTPLFYVVGDVLGRENTTRKFEHLSAEVGGSADVGLHLLRRTPEVNLALRGSVYHRANVSRIPDDLLPIIPIGTARDIETYLAPSYRMVSVVVQLTRGDFFERQRAERLPLPRYDCTAEIGYLMPHNSPAGGVRCSGSVRVSPHGYVSILGSYTLGLLGIEDATNVRTSLAYTQFFL